MPIKDGREYRSFEVSDLKLSEEKDSYIVEGYATIFDQPYEMYGGFKECIERSALDGADMSDVIFLLNHEGSPAARLRNNTLAIMPDEHGLYVRADLGGSRHGRDMHEAIKSGLIDRMSWAFMVAEDGWEYDEHERVATVTRISKVFDVSAVSRPACEATEIHARSYFDGVIEMEAQELCKRNRDAEELQRLALRMNFVKLGE